MGFSCVLASPHLLSAEALAAVLRAMPLGEVQGRAESTLGLVGTALGDSLALFSTSLVSTSQESCMSCSGQVFPCQKMN